MKRCFIITSIIVLLSLILIALYNFGIFTYRNNFNDITTEFNIVDYIEDVQKIQAQQLANNPSIKDILLSKETTPNIEYTVPSEIKELGFSSCQDAIQYYKNNNLNMYEHLPDSKDSVKLQQPLAQLCSEYLKGNAATQLQDLTDFNENIASIVSDVNKNINGKYAKLNTQNIKNYMESRHPQLATESVFALDKNTGWAPLGVHSVEEALPGKILNFYKNKMNTKLDPNLQMYTNFIYGNYSIIPNQFILLNELDIQILSNVINFNLYGQTIFSYDYSFSDINISTKIIYIYIGELNKFTMSNDVITSYDLDKIIAFLTELGFKQGKFIHITEVKPLVFAIKTSDFKTMFLIKKNIATTDKQFEFTVSL